jgi:hypothetical protein
MDEIEQMVQETFKHFHENFQNVENATKSIPADLMRPGLPTDPGILYHIQKSPSVFVIRTLVSQNIREDYLKILDNPEDYPSLRLVEGEADEIDTRLRFFIVENHYQAEVIHDQLNNRRFPVDEEMMCNLSDPGFSWWMTSRENSLQVAFNLSSSLEGGAVKLGPLGDRELAVKSFLKFGELLSSSGLHLSIQNEPNRVIFEEEEKLLTQDIQDLFEIGIVGDGLSELFRLLAKKSTDCGTMESLWYYFQELASIRRFWIQIQYDLEARAVKN